MKIKKIVIFLLTLILVLCCSNPIFAFNSKSIEKTETTQIVKVDSTKLQEEKNTDKYTDLFTDVLIPLVLEFIGAFLGVLTAIWLNSHANKKQYKELNEALYNELLALYSDLSTHLIEEEEYYRYLTPVWDINLASGNLSILTNKHIDKKYIKIYSKIQYAQELECEYIHSKLLEDSTNGNFLCAYITTINNARIREAKEILSLIDELKNKEVKQCPEKM